VRGRGRRSGCPRAAPFNDPRRRHQAVAPPGSGYVGGGGGSWPTRCVDGGRRRVAPLRRRLAHEVGQPHPRRPHWGCGHSRAGLSPRRCCLGVPAAGRSARRPPPPPPLRVRSFCRSGRGVELSSSPAGRREWGHCLRRGSSWPPPVVTVPVGAAGAAHTGLARGVGGRRAGPARGGGACLLRWRRRRGGGYPRGAPNQRRWRRRRRPARAAPWWVAWGHAGAPNGLPRTRPCGWSRRPGFEALSQTVKFERNCHLAEPPSDASPGGVVRTHRAIEADSEDAPIWPYNSEICM